MARCTLDDLVPSFRCRRIFLEPLTGNYSEYSVQIEGSVYDTIEDEDDGVVDYLLTDTFKKNIKLYTLFSRSDSIENYINYLKTVFIDPNTLEVTEWKVSMFVTTLLDFFEDAQNTESITSQQLAESFISAMEEEEVPLLFGSVVTNVQFKSNVVRLVELIFEDVSLGNIEFGAIDFEDYTNDLIENYGAVRQDPDGNRVYDFMLPRETFTYVNNVGVEECYFHGILYFDMHELLSDRAGYTQNLPMNEEIAQWLISPVHSCHIISEKIAASPNVQDFRMSERIAEIIRSDRISPYDKFIDNISLLSEHDNFQVADTSSKLFLSYLKDPANASSNAFVTGAFYVNWIRLIGYNTKLRFIYENIYNVYNGLAWIGGSEALVGIKYSDIIDSLASSIRYIKFELYRKRTDVKEERVIISRDASNFLLRGIGGMYTGSSFRVASTEFLASGYEFYDLKFRELTHGTYKYELEVDFIDPTYNFLEERIHKLKYGISVYKRMVEYIHNNAANYNELRDELNGQAQVDLSAILNEPSIDGIQYEDWYYAMDQLFAMFCGVSFIVDQYVIATQISVTQEALAAIEADPINPDTGEAYTPKEIQELTMTLSTLQTSLISDGSALGGSFERRKIENQLRIMEDLMHAISKFFEIDSINAESSTVIQSQAEIIKFKKSWQAEANPRDLDLGFIRLADYADLSFGFTEETYEQRMAQEASIFGLESSYSNVSDFGSVTPIAIDGDGFAPDSGEVNILSLYGNLLEMGKIGIKEKNYYQSLLESGPTQGTTHEINSNDIKNNSGMFETFLANLGGTCENTTLSSMSTAVRESGNNVYAKSIDEGENTSGERPAIFGARAQYSSQDDEETLSSDEQRRAIREALIVEAKKKEDIVMRMLAHPQGYSVFDRREYIQGEFQNSRYSGDFDFATEIAGQAYPAALDSTAGRRIFTTSYNGVGSLSANVVNTQVIPYSRLVLDNTFMIYYLHNFDSNMNPVWKHLVNFDNVKSLFQSVYTQTTGQTKILCKFKRYKNSSLKIGQGSFSDRTILSEYFYLKL